MRGDKQSLSSFQGDHSRTSALHSLCSAFLGYDCTVTEGHEFLFHEQTAELSMVISRTDCGSGFVLDVCFSELEWPPDSAMDGTWSR